MSTDQPTATATPRTDRAIRAEDTGPFGCAMSHGEIMERRADFARTLERELSSAQAALAEAQAKLSERKTVHEWLNANGVPAVEEGGRPMCLLRRLAVALKIQPHKSP